MGEKSPRELATLFKTTDSGVCKQDCIDQLHYFCPSSDGESGTCCNSPSACKDSGDFCSFDATPQSIALKYWSCPRLIDLCGYQIEFEADFGGEVGKLTSESTAEWQFVNGVICAYKVVFPRQAGKNDRLAIKPTLLDNARLYITVAEDYEAKDNVYEQKLPEGTAIAATYPNEVFITIVAVSITKPASFEVSYFYEDRDDSSGEAIVEVIPEEPEGVDVFLVLTIVLLIFVILIIIVIVCCYLKLQGEQLQSRNKIIVDISKQPHVAGDKEMHIVDDYNPHQSQSDITAGYATETNPVAKGGFLRQNNKQSAEDLMKLGSGDSRMQEEPFHGLRLASQDTLDAQRIQPMINRHGPTEIDEEEKVPHAHQQRPESNVFGDSPDPPKVLRSQKLQMNESDTMRVSMVLNQGGLGSMSGQGGTGLSLPPINQRQSQQM